MTSTTHPPSAGSRDARASEHPAPSAGVHGLSIVHKTRSDPPTSAPDKPKPSPRRFEVWKEGSLAIFPGIPNHDPNAQNQGTNRGGKRGIVTDLSPASRNNLMRLLATMKRHEEAYTLTLTLPRDFESITPEQVHSCFKDLCRRFTGSELFPDMSFVWKREIQKRGALHYHLLLYGLQDKALRVCFQGWIARQWNELVCVHVIEADKARHLRWHLHRKNMQKVRGNICGYFAKYLGKDPQAGHHPIPGRWWGKVNKKALPISSHSELCLPERAAIIAHRITRKLKQKRADAAKHRAISKEIGFTRPSGELILSQFDILRLKQGHSEFQHLAAVFLSLPHASGQRWGKATFHKCTKFAKIHLISANSPQTALQIMKHVGQQMKDWKERNPF